MQLSAASLLHYFWPSMQLEVGIAKHAHLRTIETFELSFLADAYRRDQITSMYGALLFSSSGRSRPLKQRIRASPTETRTAGQITSAHSRPSIA
jgi:hypothetical protein